MILRRLLLLLWLSASLPGCQSAQGATPPAAARPSSSPIVVRGELPETSLYHLEGFWEDQRGARISLRDLRGKPQVLALIYGGCKGACPRIIDEIKQVEKSVEGSVPGRSGYLLVTMDPEVDNPARLQSLAQELNLGESWRLLRGRPEQVRELAALLDVRYRKISDSDFAHSNTISVLDAEGRLLHQKPELGAALETSVSALQGAASAVPDSCCPKT